MPLVLLTLETSFEDVTLCPGLQQENNILMDGVYLAVVKTVKITKTTTLAGKELKYFMDVMLIISADSRSATFL